MNKKIPFDEDFFLSRGQIFIFSEVTAGLAYKVIRRLRYLDEVLDPEKVIQIFIHTDGGSTDAACAIIDEIRATQHFVSTICQGRACSSGAFILAQGDRGYRIATPGSVVMLHMCSVEMPNDYINKQKSYADFCKRHNDKLFEMTAKACGKSRKMEQFKKDIENDLWMTAIEAKRFGIVDQVKQV